MVYEIIFTRYVIKYGRRRNWLCRFLQKMKKLRVISLILALVIVAGIFAGCKKEPEVTEGGVV